MRINVEYSTQHWIFPIITIGILVILGVLLIALEGRARIKAGKGFFVKPGRFFVEHYDKFKFWGTIALMVVYFFLLDKLGFTFWSIICLFLFNTLFANKAQLKNPRYPHHQPDHLRGGLPDHQRCVRHRVRHHPALRSPHH